MRPEAEEFLNRVRDAEDPTRADEVRVQRALRAAIAAGMTPSVSAHAGFDSGWFGEALSKLGLSGGKLNLLAVGAALTLASGDTRLPASGGAPSGAPVTTSPASATPAVLPDAAASPPLDGSAAQPRALALDAAGAAQERGSSSARAAPLDGAQPGARPRTRKAALPRASPEASLRAELDLLKRVQAALKRGDASFALHELEAHRTADTTLLAERRAARILALCQLGRVSDARRAAAVFAEQHPDSLQRTAVDRSCANR